MSYPEGKNAPSVNLFYGSDTEAGAEVGRLRRRRVYMPPKNKQRESIKTARLHGVRYLTATGKQVEGKTCVSVNSCCKTNNCYKKFSVETQEMMFHNFYDIREKSLQDAFLAKCMVRSDKQCKKKATNPVKKRQNTWHYSLNVAGMRTETCLNFVMSLFQVTMKRIRTIQQKVLDNDSFTEKRGTHSNRPHKLKADVLPLMAQHLSTIPSDFSHYSRDKSKLRYFSNPDLTIKTLHGLFKGYYREKTGKVLKLAYVTYVKLFYQEFHYAFSTPRSDVCDYCAECEKKLKDNPQDECKISYATHKRRFEQRKNIRQEFIERASKDDTILVIEFDYSQNFAVPRLTVNSQFYKRLFWLYCFNIHVFNHGDSYMYCFFETEGTKNANSVCSFLFDCLSKQLTKIRNIREIIMFCDAAGGQNRNRTINKFCLWFAKVNNVEITIIYPVRGHSMCQPDRNFGLIRNSLKRKEVIGTAKEYLNAIVLARKNPSPFTLIMDRSLLHEWDAALSELFLPEPLSATSKFTIMKYCRLKFKTDGTFLCSRNYRDLFTPFQYFKRKISQCVPRLTPEPTPYPSPNQGKVKDVQSLYKFLRKEDEEWIEWMLAQCTPVVSLPRLSVSIS